VIDERDLYERAIRRFPPPERSLERLIRRRDRRQRNRRVATAALALVIAAVAIGGVVEAFRRGERTEPASPGDVAWIDQFGGVGRDSAGDVAVDDHGVYVGGTTIEGGERGFLRWYDTQGLLQREERFGIGGVGGVGTNGHGSVYVTGVADGHAFVTRYDAAGAVAWSTDLGLGSGENVPNGIAVTADGVYVAGRTDQTFPGQTNSGHTDAFLAKLDPSGGLRWSREFGGGGFDDTDGLAADEEGVYLAFDIATRNQSFVRKFDPTGHVLWTRDVGADGLSPSALALGAGGVLVAGLAEPSPPDPQHSDTFVQYLAASGDVIWTRRIRTDAVFSLVGLATDQDGVIVAGQQSDGTVGPGSSDNAWRQSEDGFVRKYGLAGGLQWAQALSSPGDDLASAVAIADGAAYVAGATDGNLGGAPRAGDLDAFVAKLDDTPAAH
jgi:hypothetical protein